MADVDTAHYPQLRLICWNQAEPPVLTRQEAFGRYELYWRFVDQGTLDPREAALIQGLANEFGNGLING